MPSTETEIKEAQDRVASNSTSRKLVSSSIVSMESDKLN